MKRPLLTSACFGIAALLLVFTLLKLVNPIPYGISIGPVTFFATSVYSVIAGLTAMVVFFTTYLWPFKKISPNLFGSTNIANVEKRTTSAVSVGLHDAYRLGFADGQATGSELTIAELAKKVQAFKLAVIAAVAIAVSGCTINQAPTPTPSPVPSPSVTVTDVPADLQQQVDAALAVHPVEMAWQYHGYYLVMAERFPTYENCGQFGKIAVAVNNKFGAFRPLQQIVDARLTPLLNPPAKATTDPAVPLVMHQIAEACKRHALNR